MLALLNFRSAIIGTLAFIVGVGIGYFLGDWRGYYKGYAAALNVVEKQDDKAKDAARKARSTVDECYDVGGVWRQSTGKCDR